MKIFLKEMEVTLSHEEAAGPLGEMFSRWVEKTPGLQETCLLPTLEIANQLDMGVEAFRLWLYRDERLQKLAYRRDGSHAPLRSRVAKYFRLSEVRALYGDRKKAKLPSEGGGSPYFTTDTIGANP